MQLITDFFVCAAAVSLVLIAWRRSPTAGFVALALAAVAFAAYAQDLPPGLTMTPTGDPLIAPPDWLPAVLRPWWSFWLTASSIGWVLAQVRAWIPPLTGGLGIALRVLDFIAGNYRHARNGG